MLGKGDEMKIVMLFVVAAVIIKLGFNVMKKIDLYQREQNRQKGLPMDEED